MVAGVEVLKPENWKGAILRDLVKTDVRIREGRFQKGLALIAGLSSILSGLEVTYEHYKGSYSRRIMYTPVVLSGALLAAGILAFKSRRAARTVLPVVSAITLADSTLGFYFHIRGIQRKPGGWRLPVANIVMGPPLFAPLLFGVSAYLGVVACSLRRSGDPRERGLPIPAQAGHWAGFLSGGRRELISRKQDLREGRIQRHVATATILCSFFSGFEALYSHYKNNFQYRVQWTPIVIAPMLMASAGASMVSRRAARTWLPACSLLAMANGGIGFWYHARGVIRRPGGRDMVFYNILYGPPVFAPLLFAACGFLGLLASLFRREK